MDYLHVKSLEKYHPGYKDRDLKWFKCYFKMVNADPEFEMLCEIDKWRFIALIILELQYQKPIPLDDNYLRRKGFDFKKRPMSLTVQMLHQSVEVVTGEEKPRDDSVTQIRVDKIREEEDKEKENCIPDNLNDPKFLQAWEDWAKYRIEIRHKLTPLSIEKQLKLLAGFTVSQAVEIIDKSIRNSWRGLFPDREDGKSVSGKIMLFPISGKVCCKDRCEQVAVYKATGGSFDHYYCSDCMPESVKEKYE